MEKIEEKARELLHKYNEITGDYTTLGLVKFVYTTRNDEVVKGLETRISFLNDLIELYDDDLDKAKLSELSDLLTKLKQPNNK